MEENKKITDEERIQLAEKLDKELDEFISGLERKQYTEGWPEDRWEEEMDKHPFFMKRAPEPGEELHPLLEGIQQLKYDPEENTAEELAVSYKEDGNFNFKHKKYRLAILSYTEGINQKFNNDNLRATLYNNRSASHFYLKNYRSSLRDSEIALKHKPDYEKALTRAAGCCFEMEQFDKCIDYCDKILFKQPESREILTLRQKAVNTRKNEERDARRRETAEKKKKLEDEMLIEEIKKRGIKLDVQKDALRVENLEPKFPELVHSRVSLDGNKNLVWPILIMFPEYKMTEFVQSYSENDKILGILHILFEEPAQWDTEKKYQHDNVNVYFENKKKRKINKVSTEDLLKDVLKHEDYVLTGGIPIFIILASGSHAEKHFLLSYN